MENAARLADAIIVNSQSTEEAFRSRFGDQLATGTLVVAPLGVAPPARIERPPVPPQQPYFVMLGTIEPRKKHRLVLDYAQQHPHGVRPKFADSASGRGQPGSSILPSSMLR